MYQCNRCLIDFTAGEATWIPFYATADKDSKPHCPDCGSGDVFEQEDLDTRGDFEAHCKLDDEALEGIANA